MSRLRVYVDPIGLHSRAMIRVANALTRHAPLDRVQIVARPSHADVQVLHLIDMPETPVPAGNAIIQYCLRSTCCPDPGQWLDTWSQARLVWSYYDLGAALRILTTHPVPFNFYHAPLGIDDTFLCAPGVNQVRHLIVTSGYVTGRVAEAIEEVWEAARVAGLPCHHVGPAHVQGLVRPASFYGVTCQENIPDTALAHLYRRALWVSGLRHVEGFELPAAEGLACGARPLLFDQPDQLHWYSGHGAFLPDEAHGSELVDRLVELFKHGPDPVKPEERDDVIKTFDWPTIAHGFWQSLLQPDTQVVTP